MGIEFTFSFLVLVLLAAILFYLHIKFGNGVVTHITTYPFRLAIVYILVSLIECGALLYDINIHNDGIFDNFVEEWINTNSIKIFYMISELAKIGIIEVFINH